MHCLGRVAALPTRARALSTTTAEHWDAIYKTNKPDKWSWFQTRADLSVSLIKSVTTKHASETSIIDVGGGASPLVGCLLHEGYKKIKVLDISEEALHLSQQELGERAKEVEWLVGDVTTFGHSLEPCDIWHDRAVFHFLVSSEEQKKYIEVLTYTVPLGGHLIISTFALDGPEKCSNLPICKYDGGTLAATFSPYFRLLRLQKHQHLTPFGTVQPFIYAVFKKL
jgi:hypothetical protein